MCANQSNTWSIEGICYHQFMVKNGFFITFEGTDGVGKSTQARLAAEWLRSHGHTVNLTREPGGGPLAEQVRDLLLNPKNSMQPLTELLLYQAARVEHIHQVIEPALKKGEIVLCDRFTDATLAYQGHARGLLKESIALNKLVCGSLKPDLTLLFDLPTRHALEKAKARHSAKTGDRLEQEGLSFQEKVRKGYLAVAKGDPRRIHIVRVKPSIEETQADIQKLIGHFLDGHSRTRKRT